jgi:CD109 antigen
MMADGFLQTRRAFLAGSAAAIVVVGGGGIALLRNRSASAIPVTPSSVGSTATPDATPLPGPSATPTLASRIAAIATGSPLAPSSGDGYVAVAPRTMRTGQTERVSVSLFQGNSSGSDTVTVALVKDGKAIAQSQSVVSGRGSLDLAVPQVPAGEYQLTIAGKDFRDQTAVQIQDGTLIFLETDKPIYKPGQTIQMRVLALDPLLRPTSGAVSIEAIDAKGIKVFKKPVTVDDFGMASAELPLSTEPNLGVWKLRAILGQRTTELDVRVERYVLPKFEITLDLQKTWALVSEPINGTVSAVYSFGKVVKGEMEIVAQRYVGTWQEYARVTKPLDGKTTFTLPAVGYASGSPAAGGQGSVRLDVAVREEATDYEEQTSSLVTITTSATVLRIIPESATFKPSLPFTILITAETPDKKPANADVQLQLSYQNAQFGQLQQLRQQVAVRSGVGTVTITPPTDAAVLLLQAQATGNAYAAPVIVRAGYSPSGSFIRVAQTSTGALKVGDTATFTVSATREARTFYYEVLARGRVVFSDVAQGSTISLPLTPAMTPSARLLVYQLLQNAEVAADWVPFQVSGNYPQAVQVRPDHAEVKPGDAVNVQVQTEGVAKVGLAAVDKSVFILAENRLNLQQVFDELERAFAAPQAELHPGEPVPVVGGPAVGVAPPQDAGAQAKFAATPPASLPGAKQIFQDAGVVVLTNRQVPDAKQIARPQPAVAPAAPAAVGAAAPAQGQAAKNAVGAEQAQSDAASAPLAEVQRVRQFFPETWIWKSFTTDTAGRSTQKLTAPDSITTWMLRSVALSKEKGLGIGEAELRVFQPFFLQVDLPYSVIRSEEFPVKIALYNYETTARQYTVELDEAPWFTLLENRTKTVTVDASNVGAASFMIRPTGIGVGQLKVTARSSATADAVLKDLIVDPEGVAREVVENVVVTSDAPHTVNLGVPPTAVDGSARSMIALTGNVLSQTIDGLDSLLAMPFGCGEQNMILFAPDVFITRYLKETSQLKVEVMAKAEMLMLTGYQRELTYRRNDASFSAFGNNDPQGSLWLTAFVLKTFAQAKSVIFIDDTVLTSARDWIRRAQKSDGSFDAIGFLHHQDLLGGLSGKTALTAYVASALLEAGDTDTALRAVRYLEHNLDSIEDAYGTALTTYALALAKSPRLGAARDKLMALAHDSEDGLWWGDLAPVAQPVTGQAPAGIAAPVPPFRRNNASAIIETTGYATLALVMLKDLVNASRATRWLASKRNAKGGFGSTQDTVVALQAMTSAATVSRSDIDATILLQSGSWSKTVQINAGNADVMHFIEAPANASITLSVQGKGQVLTQAVNRFNLPEAAVVAESPFKLDVQYGADHVAVNDLLDVTATVQFTTPPIVPLPSTAAPPAATAIPEITSPIPPVRAGMVVLDVAMPTGFAPETPSIDALVRRLGKIKRWDVAGRKVIFYIDDMVPGDQLTFSFQARALYPVRAQAVTSQVYAYYQPEWRGESLSAKVAVGA